MSVVKCKNKNTKHAKHRAIQRNVNPTFTAARKYGLNSTEIRQALGESNELADYIFVREMQRNKAVRLYNGSIYIFSKHSDQCITCYNLPQKYIEDNLKLAGIIDKKRLKHKKRNEKK